MTDGEQWLFRPAVRGLMKAESIINAESGVDLAYIALLNEALDVEAENEHRVRKALEKK